MGKPLGAEVSHRTMVKRILVWFDRATAADIAAGSAWYGEAYRTADAMAAATGHPVDTVAAVIAHLSPQTRWVQNVNAAWSLLATDTRAPGMLIENYGRAVKAVHAPDPLATFGPRAHKTDAFALAILGDSDAVVIDVWAARAALQGAAYRLRDGLGNAVAHRIKRKGVYDAVAQAYRSAARSRNVTPCQMQAIVWTVIRGTAE